MRLIILITSLASLIFMTGCETTVFVPDYTPPAVPRGVYAEAGDNYVDLFWQPNTDPDIAGYRVYVKTESMAKFQFLGSASDNHFYDKGAPNGITYYYGITAYDVNGNESELSYDIGIATPRPEGYDAVLKNYRNYPIISGYDFSTGTVGPYDDQYTDVYFENYDGIRYLVVWDDTEIQDMGYTSSLYDIVKSPTKGWSPTGDAVAIAGHTYVIRTWDNHYAKIRIVDLSASTVQFDWAYQLQADNPFLKLNPTAERTPLSYTSLDRPR
jgi:hypothetical protein